VSGVAPGPWIAPKTAEAHRRLRLAQERNFQVRRLKGVLAVLANLRSDAARTTDDPDTLAALSENLDAAMAAVARTITYAKLRRNPPRPRKHRRNTS
jgi:hypothetical protein